MARNKYPEETLEKILDTATRLFMEKGFEKTTIQDIVDGLDGLSRGAVYHHFKSKDELIDAVAARLHTYYIAENGPDWQEGTTGLERLRLLCLHSIRLQTVHSQLYVPAVALLQNPRMLAEQLQLTVVSSAPEIARLLLEGMEDGSIPSTLDPLHAAEIVALLLNIWCAPTVVAHTADELTARFATLRHVCDAMGLPFMDDEVMQACREYADMYLPEKAE